MTGNDSAFARWLGVNKSSVSRARHAGRLVLAADGQVDFEQSAARWHETSGGRTDVAARHAANRGAALPTARPVEENATERSAEDRAPMESADTSGRRAGAKAALLHYENSLIKLEMALRRGLRLDRAAIKRESLGLGAMLRAGIERVIDQTAPRLAVMTAPDRRRELLGAELRAVRRALRAEFPRALRRLRSASQRGDA